MILLDIMDVLETLNEDQRELVIAALLKQLSVYSHYTILEAQLNWDGRSAYNDFITYQNEILKECVKIEMSLFGKVMRKQYGLEPLNLRSEISL